MIDCWDGIGLKDIVVIKINESLGNEMVLPPETLDDLAVSAIEGAWPFNHIIVECSLKILTVGKH